MSYVIFDVETTGLDAYNGHKITEIGALQLSDEGVEGEAFSTLVNPGRLIDPECVEITGITDQMVVEAPIYSKVIPQLIDFIGDRTVVAHNAEFDMSFLGAALVDVYGPEVTMPPSLCTMRMAKRLLKDLPRHRLDDLIDYFQLNGQEGERHRALDDVRVTAKVFKKLRELDGQPLVKKEAGLEQQSLF